MTFSMRLSIAIAVMAVAITGAASAQGVEQSVSVPGTSSPSLATGYRTSKVVGRLVVNEGNIPVARIDDLIVTPNDNVPFAVLSVGGFLGMDSKYVVVPFSSIEIQDDRLIFFGATRDSLEKLPAFHYKT
jgi:type IV secretory pathway protease TraF